MNVCLKIILYKDENIRCYIDVIADFRTSEVVPVLMISAACGQSRVLFLSSLLIVMMFLPLLLLLFLLLLLDDATAIIDVRCVVVNDADVSELNVWLCQAVTASLQRLQIASLDWNSDTINMTTPYEFNFKTKQFLKLCSSRIRLGTRSSLCVVWPTILHDGTKFGVMSQNI